MSMVPQPQVITAEEMYAQGLWQAKRVAGGLAFWNTRIRDFKASIGEIAIGESVTFEGYLEWQFGMWWYGLDGQVVKLKVNDQEVAETSCGGGGYFRFIQTFSSKGKFLVKARYDGDAISYQGSDSSPVEISVITKEEKEEKDRMFWITVAGVGGVAVVVVVGALYWLRERERREMLLMAAAR